MKGIGSSVQFPELEREVLSFWQKYQVFEKSLSERKNAPQYSFYDGPPFANGLPHYGHLLANTVKDVVPRYWTMRGYQVDRRFGWDCHGLPVEYEIEKREGFKGRQDILAIGIEKFNRLCKESVLHYAGEWRKTITRLGRWVDWNRQYRTMDLEFMESVWWVFSELYRKGLVYQDYKVVPYSPRITAVLSNFEANQNYKDVQDPALTVKFKLIDEEAYMLAWTTTPWTLISNQALVVHPDMNYVKVQDLKSGEFYYAAEERAKDIFQDKKSKEPTYKVLETLTGAKLKGRRYEPLFSYFRDQPGSFVVLLGDHVKAGEGTGVIHTAPCYGEEDFNVCKQNGIDFVDALDEEGRFIDKITEYRGKFIKDADKDIIKDLKTRNMVYRHETIVHSYPFCERTDAPLIYRAIPAWYVAVEKVKDNLVANNLKVNWVPGHLREGRMGKWLENARDWAIGRNRFWGTPLPIWVCDTDPEHRQCISSRAELEKLSGQRIEDLHKEFVDNLTFNCEKCSGTMKRVAEVFDCWFESGSMPYAQIHYPFESKANFDKVFPADFVAEGLDQTRGWFYTLSVLSTALFNKPAFKNVVVNGLVLAEDGRKMSKRWRNYTPPEELMEEFGADSVRLYMLNSAILRGEDLRFSNAGVKDTTRAVLLPLWNALSFLTTYAEIDKWSPGKEMLSDNPPVLSNKMDQWIVSRLHLLLDAVKVEMEQYKLYNVVPKLGEFIEDLTNWYIRLGRRRFWGGDKVLSKDSEDAYKTLYYVLLTYSKILAPFAPFVAETIYRHLTDGIKDAPLSVHLCRMPETDKAVINRDLEEEMALVRNIAEQGRSLRAKHQVRTRQVLAELLVISRNAAAQKIIERSADLIKLELNVKNLRFSTKESEFVNLIVKPNLRTLGKRLGKDLAAFRTTLEQMSASPDKVEALIGDAEAGKTVNIGGFDVTLEDLLIERSPKQEGLMATAGGVTILLDTKLTDELILEGLSREVVNRVQKLRKDGGLNISDRIALTIKAEGKIKEAITAHQPYIMSEVLADSLSFAPDLGASPVKEQFEIDEHHLGVGLRTV
jgi:isoleucyl-tRNA synthetase